MASDTTGRVVAVIGASNDRRKFGNKAVRAFAAEGHTVVPINLTAKKIEGLTAYPSVLDVSGPIDMATVYLPADTALRVLPDLAAKGIPEIWVNPGAESDALLEKARALKLNVFAACSIVGIGRNPYQF